MSNRLLHAVLFMSSNLFGIGKRVLIVFHLSSSNATSILAFKSFGSGYIIGIIIRVQQLKRMESIWIWIFLPEILAESVNVGDICVEGGIVVMQEADERIIAANDTSS
jgi:hypothetical protein